MMRSHKGIAMSAANAKGDALKWLRQFLGMSSALVLNVAGPRESKAPGIQTRANAFLEELLWEAAACKSKRGFEKVNVGLVS